MCKSVSKSTVKLLDDFIYRDAKVEILSLLSNKKLFSKQRGLFCRTVNINLLSILSLGGTKVSYIYIFSRDILPYFESPMNKNNYYCLSDSNKNEMAISQ